MTEMILVIGIFAVLVTLEWRYRRRSLRLATALLALAVLFFYQPNYTWARRKALGTPPGERVTHSPVMGSEHLTLSEYHSGVYTTMQWVEMYANVGAGARLAAIGALFVLACSPAFWQVQRASKTSRPESSVSPKS
jgi:hypothetical protein